MSIEESPTPAIWGNIDTMPSLTPRPGITMWPLGGTNLMVNLVRVEPGAEVPLHQHSQEQGGTVIEGSISMTIDGETREMRVGDIYIAPPNSVHGAIGGPDGCLIADIFSPPRADYLDTAR